MTRLILFAGATALFVVVTLAPPVTAQGAAGAPAAQGGRGRGAAPAAPAGPTPRLANGKPDLSGLWANPYSPNMAGGRGGAVDTKTRQPLTFARKGEKYPDDPRDGQGNIKTFDLP